MRSQHKEALRACKTAAGYLPAQITTMQAGASLGCYTHAMVRTWAQLRCCCRYFFTSNPTLELEHATLHSRPLLIATCDNTSSRPGCWSAVTPLLRPALRHKYKPLLLPAGVPINTLQAQQQQQRHCQQQQQVFVSSRIVNATSNCSSLRGLPCLCLKLSLTCM